MGYAFAPDVKRLVDQRMATGQYASEDELLQEALAEESEELAAIQEAIDELEAGDPGVLLAEAFEAVRRRYGVPPAR